MGEVWDAITCPVHKIHSAHCLLQLHACWGRISMHTMVKGSGWVYDYPHDYASHCALDKMIPTGILFLILLSSECFTLESEQGSLDLA